ncbi:MAG: hypothetical protein ABEJ74_07625 [Haloferacaceae archaeon]
MAIWVWLLALVIVMTLLQLVVYRRLSEEPGGEPPPRDAGEETTPAARLEFDPGRPTDSPGGDARRCPHCGAENDPDSVYTYCASCVRRLR